MSAAELLDRDELFEMRLRQWSRYYGERRPKDEVVEAGAGLYRSPAAAIAGGTRQDAIASAANAIGISRDSSGRRMLMGHVAGTMDRKGNIAPVPAWAADPIRGTQTRVHGVNSYAPDDVERIERAVLDMQRVLPVNGLAFRLHYCSIGSPTDKADRMDIGRNKFRELVAEGRGWLKCKLGA